MCHVSLCVSVHKRVCEFYKLRQELQKRPLCFSPRFIHYVKVSQCSILSLKHLSKDHVWRLCALRK